MALNLSRSQSIPSDTCTRQSLYDVLSTCSITGTVDTSYITITHSMEITAVSQPPNVPTNLSTWWYDLTHELLKVPVIAVGSSACSLWLSVGPDAWDIPVLNSNTYTIEKGELCSYSSSGGLKDVVRTGGFTPSANHPQAWLEAMRGEATLRGYIGVARDDIGPGEFGAVTWKGFVYTKVDLSGVSTTYNTPCFLSISTAQTSTALALETQTPYNYPNIIGGVISRPTGFAGQTLCPCFLQGPWGSGTNISSSAATNTGLL